MLSSTSSTPPVRSSNVFLGSPTCSHLDSRSATRFSTPGRCLALMPNSWVAARKVISRRQSAWNFSLVAPLFNTATDALLSHLTTTLFPDSSCAQRRSATRIVRSSRALMCKACCNTDLGNSEWKNLPWNHPPQPSRQASVVKTAPGADHSSSGIIETPLYETRNLLHHVRSALASLDMGNDPDLGAFLSSLNNLIVKILPGLTQAAANFNLPNKLSSCFLVHCSAVSQLSNRSRSSWSLLLSIDAVRLLESNSIPRNSIWLAGEHLFFDCIA